MATSQQQGTYLGTVLIGFTVLTAGMVLGGGIGKGIAILGAALLVYSAIGFHRIKDVPSAD